MGYSAAQDGFCCKPDGNPESADCSSDMNAMSVHVNHTADASNAQGSGGHDSHDLRRRTRAGNIAQLGPVWGGAVRFRCGTIILSHYCRG